MSLKSYIKWLLGSIVLIGIMDAFLTQFNWLFMPLWCGTNVFAAIVFFLDGLLCDAKVNFKFI